MHARIISFGLFLFAIGLLLPSVHASYYSVSVPSYSNSTLAPYAPLVSPSYYGNHYPAYSTTTPTFAYPLAYTFVYSQPTLPAVVVGVTYKQSTNSFANYTKKIASQKIHSVDPLKEYVKAENDGILHKQPFENIRNTISVLSLFG